VSPLKKETYARLGRESFQGGAPGFKTVTFVEGSNATER
jgi:hypothetical protein